MTSQGATCLPYMVTEVDQHGRPARPPYLEEYCVGFYASFDEAQEMADGLGDEDGTNNHAVFALVRMIGTPKADPRVVWRVQWYCRMDDGEGDMPQGRQDFDNEAEARAYYESDEVRSRVETCWRAELQTRTAHPWQTVADTDFAKGGIRTHA